jgi:hypothetical protein
MVAAMKRQYVFSSTAEEDFFEEKPSSIPGCPSRFVIL